MASYNRLLVTGHLGFIASTFCHRYKDNYQITGVDFAGWGSMERNLVPGVRDLRADIADGEKLRSIIVEVRPDAIINFAAESHVDRSNEDDSCFWRSNVMGARNLAHEAMRLGIRMVQVSTDEVYGDAHASNAPWTETSPINPKNPYSVTKAAAEMLLAVYGRSERHHLDIVITRGANTIGPRQFPEKAVPKAVWCFTHDIEFPLFRTPARRMWMHVDDHAAGIEAALRKGNKGAVYNIAPSFDSEEMTVTVIRRVRDIIGKGTIREVQDRANYDLRYWMDSSKAKRELGWTAKYTLDETVKATVGWYLENGGWLEAANNLPAGGGKG
ncbi:MAG: GDP-mannose 4,6-dehydratase [Chitinispirillaceae bacterium]|nr:GDP-mannose 4,6-dehydratase [Chitinispirillaceae bacterium]